MAMIQGECPKCGKRVLHVNIENVVGVADGSTTLEELLSTTPDVQWASALKESS